MGVVTVVCIVNLNNCWVCGEGRDGGTEGGMEEGRKGGREGGREGQAILYMCNI